MPTNEDRNHWESILEERIKDISALQLELNSVMARLIAARKNLISWIRVTPYPEPGPLATDREDLA